MVRSVLNAPQTYRKKPGGADCTLPRELRCAPLRRLLPAYSRAARSASALAALEAEHAGKAAQFTTLKPWLDGGAI